MPTRREFLTTCALTGAALTGAAMGASRLAGCAPAAAEKESVPMPTSHRPLVLSTWYFGRNANAAAWEILGRSDGVALDAVEMGARQPEANPENHTVGLGGFPDRDGHVTLDACIMDHERRAGSVACLEHILHPVSVARRVMEKTPHVMLVGDGALQFALAEGFPRENLLTPAAEQAWREWQRESKYEPKANIENHDTLGILAMDAQGRLAGACTTSGLAFKMHGRVGDSPIIGAALYVDGEVGGACATGHGEYVMRTLGSFLVVELMRQGRTPQQACEEAIDRVLKDLRGQVGEAQVGYLALDAGGRVGACSVQPGFQYALRTKEADEVTDALSRT
jgi:N4-(beta-N-acetylglucosaminyl)-L-asparaginase